MSWEKIELGEICSKIGSGATPKGGKSVYIDSGVHQIRSQNVRNLQFDYDGLVCITDEAAKKLSGVTVEPDDVLLNITGDSVARVCQVPDEVLPARVNQHVAIVRPDKDKVRPRFLSYYLASPFMQSYMLKLANGKGASRNALTKDMIAAFRVPCPSLDTQDSIIDVLSAYDNLIENNRRQIALLEEAARRLYKEWFVDLRYPNRKASVDRTSWTQLPLTECASIIRGRSYTSAEIDGDEGIALVNLKNLRSYGGWSGGAEKTYTGAFKEEQHVSPGDIIMGVTDMTKERRLVGHVALVPDLEREAIISMDLVKLVPTQVERLYLYALLRFSGIAEKIALLANGTNVLHLKPQILSSVQIPVPGSELQLAFAKYVSPMIDEINLCTRRIVSAQEARNRLLPKLTSGEVEV